MYAMCQYFPDISQGLNLSLCVIQMQSTAIRLQFCFAIQIKLCNQTAMQKDCSLIAEIALWLLRLQRFSNLHIQLVNPTASQWLQSPQSNCNLHNQTAMQEDCSLIAEIALWLWRLHTDCWDCNMIADIAHWLLRLQIFRNLHIRLVIPPRVGEVAWELPQGNGTRMIEWVRMQELLSDCWYFALIAYWLLRLQSNCWDCCLIAEIAVWLWRLKLDCWDCKVSATCVI